MRASANCAGSYQTAQTAARSSSAPGGNGSGSEGFLRRLLSTAAVLAAAASLLPGCQQFSFWPARGPTANLAAKSELVVDAADVVPNVKFSGPGYSVAPRAPVVDHNLVFLIKTEFGMIEAPGQNLLELRLYEMQCIEQAAKIRGVRQIIQGAVGSLSNTVEGAETLLLDPIGSAERAPKGLERMARTQLDHASRRAGNPERRQLAARLGCDPETHNPILDRMLDEIELQRLIGSIPVQFIPYTGILRLTTDIAREVASTPPYEINGRLQNELADAGVEERLRRKFCLDEHFTTLQRLQFMEQYRRLQGVANQNAMLELAVAGESETDALGAIETCQTLADLHARRPIARLVDRGLALAGLRPEPPAKRFGLRSLPIPGLQGEPPAPPLALQGLPVAVLRDGGHVIYAPYDYVTCTSGVESALKSYRTDFPLSPTTVICRGCVMPEARRVLEAAGITVQEHSRVVAP